MINWAALAWLLSIRRISLSYDSVTGPLVDRINSPMVLWLQHLSVAIPFTENAGKS